MKNAIFIDTEGVNLCSNKMEVINKKMLDDFQDVFNDVKSSTDAWEGKASKQAIIGFGKLNGIINKQKDDLDKCVKCLKNVVIDGYLNIESTNTHLSDAFK